MRYILLMIIMLNSITANTNDVNNMLWSINDKGYPINFYKDYLLFKQLDGIKPNGFTLINLNNGENIWNSQNDLSVVSTYSNDSFIINNCVIIDDTTNNMVKCFDILSGKEIWSSKELYGYKLPYFIIDNKYYSYYEKMYPDDNQFGQLVQININSGQISDQLHIQKIINKGDNIRIMDCNSTYIIYYYDLKIWCYNLQTQNNVWSTYGTAVSKVLLTNNFLFFSELNTDCVKMDNYYITIVKTSDWKTIYRFRGSRNFLFENDKLFYFKNQCGIENDQAVEYINLSNSNITRAPLDENSSTDFFSSYKDYILIINGKELKNITLFDKDLNRFYSTQLSCNGYQYMVHKDYLIMKKLYDNCKTQGDFTYACYALPDYKPPEMAPPFNLIKWILDFIFRKLTFQP